MNSFSTLKHLSLFFLTFFELIPTLTSCDPAPEEDIKPEFYLIDIDERSEEFDALIYQDESNMVFVSEYESGIMKELYVVSGKDTLAVAFAETGYPEFLKVGDKYALFGDFSEHSVHTLLIDDKEGNYEVTDLDTDINWREYGKTIGNIATKGRLGMTLNKEGWNLATTAVVETVMKTQAYFSGVPGAPTPVSIGTFLFSSVGYAVSDNPTWWDVVDVVSNGTNYSYMVVQAGKAAAKIGGAFPYTVLISANVIVWGVVFAEIYYGIKNGSFGIPWEQDYEFFQKEIEGGFWFYTPSPAVIDWQAQEVNAIIKIGKANFDYIYTPGTFEIGVKKGITLPEGWTADVVPQGRDFALKVSVTPNLTDKTITCRIPVYVAGVHNIQNDKVFEIQQTPQIQISPKEIHFSDLTPATVSITSFSYEDWTVISWPEWLDVSVDRSATQAVNSMTLTPIRLEGAAEGSVVLSVTSGNGTGHYEKDIPVYPYDQESAELHALRTKFVKFFYDTGGLTTWYNTDNWCSDKPLEEWYGLSRSENGWTMELGLNGLSGSGDLSGLAGLYSVNVVCGPGNPLQFLDVSGCTDLEGLDVGGHLQILEASGCTKLKYFPSSGSYYPNSDLRSLNLSQCTALENVDCHGKLEFIHLSGCTALKLLFLEECKNLTSIDLLGCTSLEYLSCSNGNLQSLDLTCCPSIKNVSCCNNGLKSLNISSCTSLVSLDCSINELPSLSLSGCTALITLDCSSNLLTQLNVSPCRNLDKLYCSNNHIKQQITNEDKLSVFSHDVRYYYYQKWDDKQEKYITAYTEFPYGWYYPGEPEKGYHGR